ncbi:MAG: S41 family peptidase [Lachnospiraceae bacterium]|nr:S41 family peptidase [Lachnospiraceae bacterium]
MEENIVTENTVETKKKKGKGVKGFFKGLLIFVLGSTTGTLITLLIVLIAGLLMYSFNQQKMSQIVGTNGFIDAEAATKLDILEDMIEYYYYEDVDREDLKNGLYQGLMTSVGDPYTCYYTPEELKDMNADWNGNYEGVGAYIKLDTEVGYPMMESFIEGGSAGECEELTAGDYIIEVEGEDVYGQTLNEVVSKIKGPEGTFVNITMEGANGRYKIDLERRKIETPTVKVNDEGDNIWKIQVTEFDNITISQFDDALKQIKEAGAEGLIIDLRGNPGGNLNAVVDMCNNILPEGVIVYTEDKNGKRVDYTSDGKNELQIPLVLLVDGGSASASEIMAGAIKDYKKGTLIGTTTFGKGIVQSVLPLGDGSAIKITTSKYYTPNGNNIHKIGIEPDIEVKLDAEKYLEDGTDSQLEYAVDYLKKEIGK